MPMTEAPQRTFVEVVVAFLAAGLLVRAPQSLYRIHKTAGVGRLDYQTDDYDSQAKEAPTGEILLISRDLAAVSVEWGCPL